MASNKAKIIPTPDVTVMRTYDIQFFVALSRALFPFPISPTSKCLAVGRYSVQSYSSKQSVKRIVSVTSQTPHPYELREAARAPLGARDGPNAARYRDTEPGISENPSSVRR